VNTTALHREEGARRAWLGDLAKADAGELERLWDALPEEARPAFTTLRAPEFGLVMVRGRTGGTGDRFNLGEMTVTRCAVRLADGTTGVAYRAGRHRRAAELSAVLDAMLQSEAHRQPHAASVLDAVREAAARRREQQARRSGATRVEFFTMTRSREQK
jgi:alpha-D-ribose 1-methylphosphonate 5-triphosphate synthase subunit PhnG